MIRQLQDEMKLLLMLKYDINKTYYVISKWPFKNPFKKPKGSSEGQSQGGPPGPPPRPGLEWHEETHRWWCGEDGCPEEHDHSETGQGGRDVGEGKSSASKRGFSAAIGQGPEAMEDAWYSALESAEKYNPEQAPSFAQVRKEDLNDFFKGNLVRYIRDGNEELTNKMREGKILLGKDKATVRGISSHLKPMKEPQTLYRGIKESLLNNKGKPAQPGDVLELSSFTSTSRDILTAMDFSTTGDASGEYSETVIELMTHPDTEAITLSDEVFYKEFETIIGSDQQMEVLETHKDVQVNPDSGVTRNYVVARMLPNT